MSKIDLPAIIHAAYAAALDDSLWGVWFDRLVQQFGGSGGLFGILDADAQAIVRPIVILAPPRAIEDYTAGQHFHDPQVGLVAGVQGATTYLGLPGVDVTKRETADYLHWQESVAKNVYGYNQAAAMPLGDGKLRAGVSIHRNHTLGAVTRSELLALRQLLPDLQHALELAFRHSELLQSAFWEGLMATKENPLALLLDERGRVIRLSDGAERLIKKRDGLDITYGHLRSINADEADGLQYVIERAIRPVAPSTTTISISRANGKKPLIVICYPLPRKSRMLAPVEAAALVRVIDRDLKIVCSNELYRQAFGLTRREAELALLLIQGHSVESAAAVLEMAMPTARTHMRQIYSKTQVPGLTDLIRLLARIG